MNKKILAVAVVAAITAPLAAMADATVYGKAHISLDNRSSDAGVAGASANAWDVRSNASRLGVKGSEDLGDGLKAIYKMEFGINMVDGTNRGATGNIAGSDGVGSLRNTYIGLKGDWGTFVIGRHDTPYKMSTGRLDMFGDTRGDYNRNSGFSDVRADNALAYISPNMNGLTLAAAIVPAGGSTANANNNNNIAITNSNADGLAEAVSLAAMYSQGPFYASLAYENLNDTLGATALNTNATDDASKWRVGLGYTMDAFKVGFAYEDRNDFTAGQSAGDMDIWMLNGSYSFGNNTLKAQYVSQDYDSAPSLAFDSDQWTIGLDHTFTKRTKVYALYTSFDSDNSVAATSADYSVFSMGMVHSF